MISKDTAKTPLSSCRRVTSTTRAGHHMVNDVNSTKKEKIKINLKFIKSTIYQEISNIFTQTGCSFSSFHHQEDFLPDHPDHHHHHHHHSIPLDLILSIPSILLIELSYWISHF